MPTYEYECPNGHRFELFQKMSDEPRAECPTCGAESRRLLSGGGGLLFKGEGFYITDYRSESYKKQASKETGGAEKEAPAETSASPAGSGKTGSGKTGSGKTDSGSTSGSDQASTPSSGTSSKES